MALDLSLHPNMSRSWRDAILEGLQHKARGNVWEGTYKADKAKSRAANRRAAARRIANKRKGH